MSTILVVLLLLLTSPAWAVTRYVSTTGSDSNSCSASTLTSTPKRNIMGANGGLACMSAGDTMYLRQGSYPEAINYQTQTIPVGTAEGNRITIASYPGETATINPSGNGIVNFGTGYIQYITFDRLVFDGANFDFFPCTAGQNSQGHLSVTNHAHHIRFQNGEMKNGVGPQVQLYAASSAPLAYSGHNEVINSKIHDATCSYGFYINQQDALIDGNEIYDNAGYGLQVYGGIYGTEANNRTIIRNNRIYGNGYYRGYGAMVIANGHDMQVYNNLFYNNFSGVSTEVQQPSTGMQFYNNTFVNNGGEGLYIGTGTTSLEVKNNIFYQNSGNSITNNGPSTSFAANLCSDTGTGCTIQNANPGFSNLAGSDFHIQLAGSPAVGSGTNLSSTFTTDAEGLSRPASGNWTIGAYEFNSAPITPLGTIAKYRFEEGSGTTAADSSGLGNTCTLTSAAWGVGIVDTFAFAPTGTQSCTATMSPGIRPTTEAGLSAWINATSMTNSTGFVVTLPGDALVLYVQSDGVLGGQAVVGGQFYNVSSGAVLTGTNRHVSLSYKSGDGLRLRLDDAQIEFQSLSGALDYSSGGGQLQVSRSDLGTGLEFSGRIDQVYAFDTEITSTMNTLLFGEMVPGEIVPLAGIRLSGGRITSGVIR